MIEILKVFTVKPLNNWELYVELSNGKKGVFDAKPYLDKGVFTQLQNEDLFKQVKSCGSGIFWKTGQDLSADTIEYKLQNKE